jgi:hypothetical protein
MLAQSVQAADIGWPEAVARLAGERTKAQTCASLFKRYGDKTQISTGQLAYGSAKANIDAVISGLVTVLAQKGQPDSLSSLDARLERGATELAGFCKTVAALLPDASGDRGVLVDIVKAAIEPIVKSLSEGIAAIYNDYGRAGILTRQSIQTQLEAAKWPNFADVEAAPL